MQNKFRFKDLGKNVDLYSITGMCLTQTQVNVRLVTIGYSRKMDYFLESVSVFTPN